jgi:hypothetical protein
MDAGDRRRSVRKRPSRSVVAAGSAIGDFLRAVAALGAQRDSAARAELAGIFGLEIRPAPIEHPKPKPPQGPVPPAPDHQARLRPGRKPPDGSTSSRHQAATGNPIPASARVVEVVDRDMPQWLVAATALPSRSPSVTTPKMSLLEPKWTRAILTTALAAPSYAGEPDEERLVQQIAAGEPVRSIPLRAILTLTRGTYCWVDRSRAMEPFVGDQAQLVSELLNVVGPSRLDVRSIDGAPFRSSDLLPGIPHLLLSDLGATIMERDGDLDGGELGDPPEMWASWAEWVARELGARVVALVPRPAPDLPAEVRKVVHVLEWDRRTSVGSVRRALAGVDA